MLLKQKTMNGEDRYIKDSIEDFKITLDEIENLEKALTTSKSANDLKFLKTDFSDQ